MNKDIKQQKGYVYILTNPSFDGWIKIGYTTDIKKRIKELSDRTSVPLSYRLYATYKTEKYIEIENAVHKIIDIVNSDLRSQEVDSHGKIVRRREFFHFPPEEAFKILKEIAKLLDETNEISLHEPTEEQYLEEEKIETKRQLSKFTFELLKIPIGSILTFINDENETVVTLDNERSVSYKGEATVLSEIAQRLLGWKWLVQGTKYFLYENETLVNRRERLYKL